MSDEKIIDKIKKCLALANSSNPHEAAAAMRQAQALMAKHRLTVTDINLFSIKETRGKSGAQQTPAKWEASLAWLCANAFGCESIFSQQLYGNALWLFLGPDAYPECAEYAFTVLLRQIKKDRRDYWRNALKRCKPINKTKRADTFCEGWVYAVRKQIEIVARTPEQQSAIDGYLALRAQTNGTVIEKLTANDRNADAKRNVNDVAAGITAGSKARLHHGVKGAEPKRIAS